MQTDDDHTSEAPDEGARPHDAEPSTALTEFMATGWDTAPRFPATTHPAAVNFAARRTALTELFPGRTLVVPTGALKVRANDTDYRFRPGSDFFWLCGHDEPDAVLVLRATDRDHDATLYLEPRADRSTPAFFTNARSGELWVGPRRGVAETAQYLGVPCAPISTLGQDLSELDPATVLTMRGLDEGVDGLTPAADEPEEQRLAADIAELRLVKDEFEITMLQAAVDSTVRAFEDVVRALPEAQEQGERVIEGVFNLRARVEGNDVGYNTIAASGAHATVLHWFRNDGEVRAGDLLLLDAGVECHELYTADVTRTMPVSGRFTPEQRTLYDLVYRAQRAGIAAVRPGAEFLAPHRAAMQVIVEGLCAMGVLHGTPADELDPKRGVLHRRYTLHGTSHMLGLDVHDCSNARDDEYRGGTLQPGHVLTVEPGLYFQSDDLTVPERLRGIGIRIEDDVLVTADGNRVLSAALPTAPDDIEAWMARVSASEPPLRQRLSRPSSPAP